MEDHRQQGGHRRWTPGARGRGCNRCSAASAPQRMVLVLAPKWLLCSKRFPKRFPRGVGTNWFLGFKKLPEASRRLPRGFKRLQEASRCIILLS